MVSHPPVPAPASLGALYEALRAAVPRGSVDVGRRRRAEYSQDASNYRQVPRAVVLPADTDELVAAVAACRAEGVPVTLRGAGTSIAGQAVGDGVVIDTSRYLNRIIDVDPEARTATVEPGVVLDDAPGARPDAGRRGPYLAQGIPLVGLEPSCTSLLRSDAEELLKDDPRARRAAASTLTFAEFLDRRAADADLGGLGRQAVTQAHCHQHATLGSAADDRVMARIGLDNERLPSGCCGLAGNFGFEKEHYGVSVALAEDALLPALRETPAASAVVADGFSCRTHITQLSGRRPVHLAELVRDSIRAGDRAGRAAPGD